MIIARIGRRFILARAWASSARPLLARAPPPPPGPTRVTELDPSPFLLAASVSFYRLAKNPVGYKVEYVNKVDRCGLSNQASADVAVAACGIFEIPLAQTGEGIAECELLKWFVQEGDKVEEFQPLCEVQSDKATIEITSRYKGRVSELLYVPGNIVKVGETLLKMVVEESQSQNQIPDGLEDTKLHGSELKTDTNGQVLCTPAVRNLSKQYGIDLNYVQGSGREGRILKEDVLKYAVHQGILKDSSFSATTEKGGVISGDDKRHYASSNLGQHRDDITVPLRGFQRTMVKTMSMAAKAPHFHYVEEIYCDALAKLKALFQRNNSDPGVKHTYLPFLIKSLSVALSKYPWVNSCLNEESVEVILKGTHNIGIAMATTHGLVVPNIKNVQSLTILEITKELSRLQQLASENKLHPDDIVGGTITLSNIGTIGGKFGAPLLNLPEVAIIALGRIQKVPRFSDDGNVYPASIMTVNIGADHRVLDGATVAKFCNEWKNLIEEPDLLMLAMR